MAGALIRINALPKHQLGKKNHNPSVSVAVRNILDKLRRNPFEFSSCFVFVM